MTNTNKPEFGNYNYADRIKTPTELGMGDKGTMNQLTYNISGMIDYINILVTGKSNASRENGGPLGDAYFVPSLSKCTDSSGLSHPRHLYINNIPTKSLPFITGKTNLPMGEFKGLVPGIIDDISSLDPSNLISSFGNTEPPECSKKTFLIKDNNGNNYKETRYVADDDSKDYQEINDNNLNCNPNTQKQVDKSNECCISDENEKKNYSISDSILCQNTNVSQEGFSTIIKTRFSPFNFHNKKKNKKYIIMFILFIILLIVIFS